MQTFQPVPIDQRLTLLKVVAHATPLNQAILLLLMASALISAATWAVQATRPDDRSPGAARAIAFLDAVLVVAPLLALAAAAYELTHISLGIANLRPQPDLATLAPGFAEMSLLAFLGLLAAGVAAAGRAHLQLKLAGAGLAA